MTITVYGASGYTGRLVIAELRRRKIDMVLVGRDKDRLSEAAAGVTDAVVRVADLTDPDVLADAFRGSDVVINCVAPFTSYGEPVVRAAIAAGAHYVDTSGEQPYLMRIFDSYADAAERAGVTVVPMANDGGFLADLLVSLTARGVGQVGDVVVAHRTTGSAGLSRGSGRTSLANLATFVGGGVVHVDGEWRDDVPSTRTSVTFPGDVAPSPVVRFAMPEIATIPRHVRARHVEGVSDAALAALFTALTPEMVESMPEGPPEEARRNVRFLLVADVDGRSGSARGVVEGNDTYGTTAVVAVELARRLAAFGAASGVLAPAQAVDAAGFLDALAPHGVHWSVTASGR